MNTNDRVIVALDFGSEAEAKALVEQLGAAASSYKVGLQLLTAEGPSIVRWLVGQGKKVFLDVKLHEIPNSVASAVTVAGSLGASMVTVHASGGSAVLRTATDDAQTSVSNFKPQNKFSVLCPPNSESRAPLPTWPRALPCTSGALVCE